MPNTAHGGHPRKSLFWAVVFPVVFGPFGLMYVSARDGFRLLAALAAWIAVWTVEGFVESPSIMDDPPLAAAVLPYGFYAVWVVSIVWSWVGARRANRNSGVVLYS